MVSEGWACEKENSWGGTRGMGGGGGREMWGRVDPGGFEGGVGGQTKEDQENLMKTQSLRDLNIAWIAMPGGSCLFCEGLLLLLQLLVM